jgi:TRAP-type C4-dicarboxylate transport system substrate-binding protein
MRLSLLWPAAAVAAGLAVSVPSAYADKTHKLKIGNSHPPAAAWNASAREQFMPRVLERMGKESKHKIEWTEAWGGTLCKPNECLEVTESGVLDLGVVLLPFHPAKLMAQNFGFFVPFGTPDPRIASKATLEVYAKVPRLGKLFEDRYNQILIGHGVIGNYGLVTNFKWSKVEELKGRKLAAAGPNIPWLLGTGAVGVQSALTEAYTSMQTGVYEGWVMFTEGVVSFKLQEISKQYVDMDFGAFQAAVLTVNKDTWKTLPPEVQKILSEEGRRWTESMAEFTWQRDQAARKTLQGVLETSVASMENKQAWAKALPNIPKQRFEEINKANQPGDAVYTYIAALKAAGHVFPRDWAAER